MAAVEPLDAPDPSDRRPWLVIRGTLREADLVSLLEGVRSDDPADATIDLLEVDGLTVGGCWALRTLADELWRQRSSLTVVFRLDSSAGDCLRSSGTMDHPHIAFQGRVQG